MTKNPYSSKEMDNDTLKIIEKICTEHEMSALEMIEVIMCNNIICAGLPIHLVYEKIWYPFYYKSRNPDEYEVPPISTADKSYLVPMEMTYRLAGVDGEATENRLESLQDEDELANDPEKKYALSRALSVRFDGEN